MSAEKLEHARWILERNLHWIATVETKTAVILSIDTALLGALAAAFCALSSSERTAWCIVVTLIAAVPISASIAYCARAVWPDTDGPPVSLIFFGRIKNWKADDYRAKFFAASDETLLTDCLDQVHRNAEIACLKYGYISLSMKMGIVSLPFWIIAIGILVGSRS